MNYGLFLYADLATGERIEILKRNFGGAPRKIAALSSWSWRPLDNDSAEVTDTPIVKGTLSMSIKDMRDFDYTAFFTVDSTLWRVVLKYGGVTRWSGYVQPESYSSNSEYRSDINIMALDNLGQLEHIEYDYFDYSFVSLRDLVQRACGLVGWNFAPIIFDTRVVSGDGVLIEDAVLNVETFRKKTWWEVLSDVLFSFGLQLAYFDDNAYRISSVANKFDATRIVNIPNHTIESGCTSDIVPPWKSASVEQNLQIINDFFYFPSGSDYSVVGSYIINAYNEKYKGISDSPLTDWGLWAAKVKTLIPNGWQNNGCNILSGQSMLNDRTGALYLETIIKDTSPSALTAFVSKQMDIPTILAGVSIELSLGSREWYVLWEDFDYSDFTEDNPLAIRGYAQKFAPWVVQSFEILYSFQITYDYVDGDGVAQKIILKEKWEKLSDKNKDSRIEFTAHIEKEVSDKKYNINIASLPAQGSLELKIFRPKLLNTGSIIKEGATSFCRIADIQMSALTMPEIGSTKTNVGIIKSARTKKGLSLSYGELPPKYTCIDYAGGVFQGVRFNPPLHDWHRTDNLGGVLPLSEIVWRGYVHHFSRFQTNAGEPAGGKVLRGRFPFEGLKLNNILKYSTKESTEYYVINSASISGREADLTLMQVSPYAHYTDFDIENFVDAGGGSFVGGGGDTYVTHMTGGGGADLNGKRLFALDEAADDQINDLYLLADKPGNTVAQKIKATAFTNRTHAKQHFKDGADEIKPYDIDAAQRAGDSTQNFTAKNLTAHENVGSEEHVSGLLGGGWNIDKNGHAEMRSLTLWERLVVPELVKNQVSISRNETWFTDGGEIKSVSDHTKKFSWSIGKKAVGIPVSGQLEPIGGVAVVAGSYVATFRKTPSFRSGDLVKAIVVNDNGFATANMRVDYLLGELVALRPLNSVLPVVDMVVARVGNDTNKERQSSIYVDALAGYIRILADINSFSIKLANIKFQGGNLSGLRGLGYNKDIPPVGVYAPGLYIGTDQVAGLGAMISAINDTIELKVSKDDFNALGKRVSTAESSITQTEEAIELKVSKDGIIGALNATAEKLKIAFGKISLEGYTTINNHFKVLANGDVEMVDATVSGTINARDGEIYGELRLGSYAEGKFVKYGSLTGSRISMFSPDGQRWAGLGEGLPAIAGWQPASLFRATGANDTKHPNVAIWAQASGNVGVTDGFGNHAIYMPSGDIAGFTRYTKRLGNSHNGMAIDVMVGFYSCYNTSDITVYLPNPNTVQPGREIKVRRNSSGNIKLVGKISAEAVVTERWAGGVGDTAVLLCDGNYWLYNYLPR